MSGIGSYIAAHGLDTVHEQPQYMPNLFNDEEIVIRPTIPGNTDSGRTQFKIGGLNDPMFFQPSSVLIAGVVEVRKQNDAPLTDADQVSCVNLFPLALFEDVTVSINNRLISNTGKYYHHKAYITQNFALNDSDKTKMYSGDYFLQNRVQDKMQVAKEKPSNDQSGFGLRMKWVKQDRMAFNMPLIWDLSSVPYIVPGQEVRLDLKHAQAEIPLLARDPNMKLKIKWRDIKLRVKRWTVPYSAPEAVNYYFTKKQYYPINRVHTQVRNIDNGCTSVWIPNVVSGQLPWHLFCVIFKRSQEAMLDMDPFCYETNGLKEYQLLKNSIPVHSDPLIVDDADTDTEGSITAYKYFKRAMGYTYKSTGYGPSKAEYLSNQFMMVWNLCPDNCVGAHDHAPMEGHCDLRLTFKEPTDKLDIFIMGVYESIITVDRGVVELNYAV